MCFFIQCEWTIVYWIFYNASNIFKNVTSKGARINITQPNTFSSTATK